ncbi:MAG TPA: glycosyl amidation-associated protein WbuZ [Myxococcales bacterium]|nr:glycosyl amidation-associated protein WbuZ [Myxococcales bacterium]
MLKVRLIPSLLLLNGRCVKGVRFADFRDVGHPITAARVYDAQGADELLFLDITASVENRSTLFEVVARAAEECFMPLTAGGGVRSLGDIRTLLRCGADKVSINTAAVERPAFIREAAETFGRQCIMLSIDCRRRADGRYEVVTRRGQDATGRDPLAWAQEAEAHGAGEILLTALDREGTRQGYDVELTRAVAKGVRVPVIAAGGAGSLQHLVDGVAAGGASAVSAASLFHFTDKSVIKAKAYMRNAGLDVRPS